MRPWRLIVTTALLLLSLLFSCGRPYQPYVPDTDMPRMVYTGHEIRNLETVPGRMYNKHVYVEVTTTEGIAETGRLIRIGQDDLVMSPGWYYSTESDSTMKMDIEKVIPKDKVIILKVF
jgi:hypothetical protein